MAEGVGVPRAFTAAPRPPSQPQRVAHFEAARPSPPQRVAPPSIRRWRAPGRLGFVAGTAVLGASVAQWAGSVPVQAPRLVLLKHHAPRSSRSSNLLKHRAPRDVSLSALARAIIRGRVAPSCTAGRLDHRVQQAGGDQVIVALGAIDDGLKVQEHAGFELHLERRADGRAQGRVHHDT